MQATYVPKKSLSSCRSPRQRGQAFSQYISATPSRLLCVQTHNSDDVYKAHRPSGPMWPGPTARSRRDLLRHYAFAAGRLIRLFTDSEPTVASHLVNGIESPCHREAREAER